ncbi:MAG: VCBS repeat-containing protein [Geodermatophilaceae bacterium]|nr:VCBS repeat-containing protein [Geodermatophilaceae bacterium]
MKKGALLMAMVALLAVLLGETALADRAPDPRFAPPKNYDNPGRGTPQNLVKGDFDEDGVVDLVMAVADSANDVSLFEGKRDGTFVQPPKQFDVARYAAYAVKSDFNGDGHLDLAVSDIGKSQTAPGAVVVLLGKGDGTFEKARSFPSGGKQPTGLAVSDVDGDGDKDLAVANSVSGDPNSAAGNVTVLLNNGEGAFEAGQSVEPPTPPSSRVGPVFLAAGDLDGDGDPDILATAFVATQAGETGNVLVLENGEGRYARGQSVAVGADPQQIVVGLFDGDRRPDFATAGGESNNVSVGLGNGDATFGKTRGFPSGGVGPTSLLARDLNKDGKKDLATTNIGEGPGGGGNVGVLTSRGDGTFKKSKTFRAGNGPAGLTAGRFYRDGRPDLAVANAFSNKLSVLKNTTPR